MKKILFILLVFISINTNAQLFKTSDFCEDTINKCWLTAIFKDSTYNPKDTIILFIAIDRELNISQRKILKKSICSHIRKDYIEKDSTLVGKIVIEPYLYEFNKHLTIDDMIKFINDDIKKNFK